MTIKEYVFGFIVRYWRELALALLLVAAYAWWTRQNQDFSARLRELDLSQKQETEEIIRAHDVERQELIENQRLLQSRLDDLQREYDKQKSDLKTKTDKKVQSYVKAYVGNPLPLTMKISSLTGIPIYQEN